MMLVLWLILVSPLLVAPAASAAKELKPSLFAEKFNTSVSFRTDVCDRQRALWNNEVALPNALRGLNLTVVLTNYAGTGEAALFAVGGAENPHLSQNKHGVTTENGGLFAVILDEVASRAGFEWHDSFGVATPLGDDDTAQNKTWSDILRWGVNTFDISMEKWGRSVQRMSSGISFPTGWYDSSIVLAERSSPSQSKSVVKVNLWSFLKPFRSALWWMIGLSILVTGILYWVLEYLNVDADERELEEKPMACIFYTAAVFTTHFELRPNTHAARILGFSWTFWGLIVGAAYTANMASFLVSPEIDVFHVRTLEEALSKDAVLCVQSGGVIQTILEGDFPDLRLLPVHGEREMYQSLFLSPEEGGCHAVAHQFNTYQSNKHNREVNSDCSIISEERIQKVLPAGMATAVGTSSEHFCTSLISHVLDFHLTNMHSDGFIAKAWKQHINQYATIQCIDETPSAGGGGDDDTIRLGLVDVGGIFILHGILSMVALAFAFFQFYYYNTKEERGTLASVFGLSRREGHTKMEAPRQSV